MTPAEARTRLVEALRLDLVGPDPDDAVHAEEVLPQAPSQWYLSGFLAPSGAEAHDRGDETGEEELDLVESGGFDDQTTPDKPAARKGFFPSSMGLSFLVPAALDRVDASVRWGDYQPEAPGIQDAEAHDRPRSGPWRRVPREASVEIHLPAGTRPSSTDVPGGNGLRLVVSVRPVPSKGMVPEGTRSVSVFLVNDRRPAPDLRKDEAFAFQAAMVLRSGVPLVPRPDQRGRDGSDWDDRVADLQYRDASEYVVGHNVSANAVLGPDGDCREVATTWIPVAEVEKVVPAHVEDVEFGMEALAGLQAADDVRAKVGPLVEAYLTWIADQARKAPTEPCHASVAAEMLGLARRAGERVAAGLRSLDDPLVLESFRIANRAMAAAARQRQAQGTEGGSPQPAAAPAWRPFQLAFLLMNLSGIADPLHADRDLVDLLFFPTGGGKTEAYLGLAAFTMVLRRLRNPGLSSAGVSVLMRYTLRLLTLDQLGRAAALVCALELERQRDVQRLGPWPFEIGLWVGTSATPNVMGRKGDTDEHSARTLTRRFQLDSRRYPSPIPLQNCPWCGTPFSTNSFTLLPDADQPTDLRITCMNRRCAFTGDNPLPILSVDEPIYRRLPCFLIATVDKFASLPWVGRTGALFGKVDRHDGEGFYGPCDPGKGKALAGPLQPPDLVIQDELHLISGPLGTMVGLYETAIEHLCSRVAGDRVVRPKVVASTATVRRAERQIRALFGRTQVDVFPPPGPDRRDSFFARTVPTAQKNGRMYVGIAAPGRSLKVAMLRTYLCLMGAAGRSWSDAGGAKAPRNPADPYMTLVGYFNSLRELGGSRRIVEDEVVHRLPTIGSRKRVGEKEGPFADRHIEGPLELTSRENTARVAETKRRLALTFAEKDCVDAALATNMISVGLDITRLGLMVVLGQPKTAAEYIQTTSRVGRDDERPGLVVTLMNVHRPRDRSHYERFRAWHETFYRSVEATSVTPFSPRAVDRGIAAVTVALARLGHKDMTAPTRAVSITSLRADLDVVADVIARRAEGHDKELSRGDAEALRKKIKGLTRDLLDVWEHLAADQVKQYAGLQYAREVGGPPPLLRDPLDPELTKVSRPARRFRAGRSLRDVELTVNLWLPKADDPEVGEEEGNEG
jgi:hypothetical protein